MKNTKHIFTLIFTILLCILSFTTIKNYDMIKDKQYDFDYFIRNNMDDIQLFLFNLVEKNDPTYQFITIDDTNEETYEIPFIYKELEYRILNFTNMIQDDPNFQYIVKKDGKYISNEFGLSSHQLHEQYHKFYAYIRFDSNGKMAYCDNKIIHYFTNNTLDDFINANYSDNTYFYDNNFWINENKITFNNPKNVELYILLPHKILPTGYTYHELTNHNEIYLIYCGILAALAFLVLSLFVFIIPINILESKNPYKTIKNWLLESNVLIFGSIIPFLGFLAIVSCKFSVDGTLEYIMNESYSNIFLKILNFVVWSLFYYLLTVIPFLIKYSITYGLFNYLKDHTILGRSYYKIKNEITTIQIGYKVIILTILAFTIPAILGILSVYWFVDFGLALDLLGYIGLFIFVLIIENKIYRQYKTLLEKTNQLSQGNFDIQIDENLGLFEDYKKELLQVKDGFEKAVQEEVKSTNMKTELITNVSHDLKTPITCIKNYVTLLENEDLDKETQKEYIKNLQQYTNRLTHLVEDLFEVSKVNSGNISIEPVELNIVDFVKQVLAENEDIFTQSNLSIVTNFEEEHISCLLDGDKTYRIFENLITNIGKYALPYTRVYVDITKNNDEVQIIFKNISKDEMNFSSEEIVERFVRGDKSRHEQGSGLGLAIVKSYTEIQNGTFNILVDGDLFKAILTFKESLISK